MAKQKQDDQLEHTYSSYVRIRDVAMKIYQEWWMMGRSGDRGSGISVLIARHDDDDILQKPLLIQVTQIIKGFLQIHELKPKLCCKSSSMQEYALGLKFFNEDGPVAASNGKALKLIDTFIYLGSIILSAESEGNVHIGKALTAVDIRYLIKKIGILWSCTRVWIYVTINGSTC